VTARFEAVLFDAGGVLVVPDGTVLGPLLAPYGASTDLGDHHRAHYAAMRAHDHEDTAGWGAYHRTYVSTLGVPGDELCDAVAVFGQTFNSMLWRYPNQGAAATLRGLVERNVPIGVVSNASGQIEAALRRAGICQVGRGEGAVVVCVIDSHVVGVSKPDPAIFVAALDLLGVPADRVAYVGDSIRYDVEGARAAGVVPLLLDPYGFGAEDGLERISALDELYDWV
jgi:putative hydrolase of the HAD superfamily